MMTGTRTESVAPLDLSADAATLLLRLARAAIEATASGEPDAFDPRALLGPEPPSAVLVPSAAFVTLHEDGELRGCIGTLTADRPLWETVVGAAVGAAFDDPRFWPVSEDEVPSLSIAVSVLGPATPLADPVDFRPGLHGVIVDRRGRRGLLLPEVATDQGWGLREMLEATCRKAGLPPGAWSDPSTEVLVFRTVHISEAAEGS